MIAAGAFVGVAAAGYGELVLDVRAPRAELAEVHAIGSSLSFKLSELANASEAMKKKYGPDAKTFLTTRPPRLVTRVGDKIVEQRKTGEFLSATGIFVVGPPGQIESTFPFEIDPRKAPERIRNGEPGSRFLQNRFGEELPARYLEFNDIDVVTDPCITISPADLGLIGSTLRFRGASFCVVFWKGASPASMLVGVALADGDSWMRPFTRRICRWITSVALARLAAIDNEPPPDYAACVLVDRPARLEAAEALKAHVYEVRRNSTLATVN